MERLIFVKKRVIIGLGLLITILSLGNLSLVSILYVHKHKAMFSYHGTILDDFIHMQHVFK
jgi:hypothetical protein